MAAAAAAARERRREQLRRWEAAVAAAPPAQGPPQPPRARSVRFERAAEFRAVCAGADLAEARAMVRAGGRALLGGANADGISALHQVGGACGKGAGLQNGRGLEGAKDSCGEQRVKWGQGGKGAGLGKGRGFGIHEAAERGRGYRRGVAWEGAGLWGGRGVGRGAWQWERGGAYERGGA